MKIRVPISGLMITLLASSMAFAQVPKAKTADKVQTREELRACLKLKDTLATSTADWQKRKDAHEATRGEIRALTEKLKADKAEVDTAMEAFKLADAELAEHTKLIDRWNEEVKEVDASKMKSAERRKAALQKERVGLEAKNKELEAARAEKVKTYDAAVASYNAKVAESQATVKAWNDKNEALEKEGDKLTDLRLDYGDKCANRRFREEDEEAIRKGL